MSRKVRIIIATVIVAIALILFGIVLLLQPKSKGKDTEASQTYATASTVDQTQTTTTDPSGEIIVGDDISADAVYTHIERLTPEQKAAKDTMTDLVASFVHSYDSQLEVKEAEVLQISSETTVFLSVTLSNNEALDLVVTFDNYNLHKFLRCGTADYYYSIANGENAG